MRPHRIATAWHEAGHALMSWRLGIPVKYVTIIPDSNSKGGCQNGGRISFSREAVENRIMVLLAGSIAQRMYNPRSVRSFHSESDRQKTVDLALLISISGKGATAFLKWLHIRAQDCLEAQRQQVQALAEELLSRKTLTGEELDSWLLQPHIWRNKSKYSQSTPPEEP